MAMPNRQSDMPVSSAGFAKGVGHARVVQANVADTALVPGPYKGLQNLPDIGRSEVYPN
jgi:hypothetical protein